MTDINVAFCRMLLAQLKPELKAARLRMFKDAWVINTGGNGTWEFHGSQDGPAKDFWWYGRCDNAYDARYQGWSAYLEKFHREERP